jgi:hypothetical protein
LQLAFEPVEAIVARWVRDAQVLDGGTSRALGHDQNAAEAELVAAGTTGRSSRFGSSGH